MTVSVSSTYAAAHFAVKGFERLPSRDSATIASLLPRPTFIFTGNLQNFNVYPSLMDLGMGKSAVSHMIEAAAAAYRGTYRFYYADERTEEGAPMMNLLNGETHAEFYAGLVDGKVQVDGRKPGEEAEVDGGAWEKQGPWCATFVKGVGYRRQPEAVDRKVNFWEVPGVEGGRQAGKGERL